MINVLFICKGNVNRSAMAEAIFCQLLKDKGLGNGFNVDSAATDKTHLGQCPYPNARKFLDEMQIPYDWIHSRAVTIDDLNLFDFIVAMDNQNLRALDSLMEVSGFKKKIPLLLDYVPERDDKEILDPSITGNYMETYQLILRGCEKLLLHILINRNLLWCHRSYNSSLI